jgi:predicted phage replisome organizer
MADIKWIKISVDMFDDEKIKIIEKMPEADTLLIIWIKLLALAGRKNSSGYIFLTESIPYTDEMLATVMGRELGLVRMALDAFEKFGMINRTEEDLLLISNWDKHQSVDKMENIKIQQRLRKQKERRKNQLLLDGYDAKTAEELAKKEVYRGLSHDSHVTSLKGHTPEEEEERDIDIDKDKEIDIKDDVDDQDHPTPPPDKKGKGGKKKRKYESDSTEYQLAQRLYNRILENSPDYKEPDFHLWADHVRLMMERDNRTSEQIAWLIDWVQQDSFWMTNILSTAKLRQKWDQLVMQMKQSRGGRNNGKNGRHYAGSAQKNADYEAGAEDLFRK